MRLQPGKVSLRWLAPSPLTSRSFLSCPRPALCQRARSCITQEVRVSCLRSGSTAHLAEGCADQGVRWEAHTAPGESWGNGWFRFGGCGKGLRVCVSHKPLGGCWSGGYTPVAEMEKCDRAFPLLTRTGSHSKVSVRDCPGGPFPSGLKMRRD